MAKIEFINGEPVFNFNISPNCIVLNNLPSTITKLDLGIYTHQKEIDCSRVPDKIDIIDLSFLKKYDYPRPHDKIDKLPFLKKNIFPRPHDKIDKLHLPETSETTMLRINAYYKYRDLY